MATKSKLPFQTEMKEIETRIPQIQAAIAELEQAIGAIDLQVMAEAQGAVVEAPKGGAFAQVAAALATAETTEQLQAKAADLRQGTVAALEQRHDDLNRAVNQLRELGKKQATQLQADRLQGLLDQYEAATISLNKLAQEIRDCPVNLLPKVGYHERDIPGYLDMAGAGTATRFRYRVALAWGEKIEDGRIVLGN
jgi:exonuclease VII small subunit